jgi:adenosylhomocysteine nucleosidase
MKYAIIGAMQEEIDCLLSVIENKKEVEIKGFKYYEGILNSKEVVISLSGIGKVNATVGTTLLIDKFNPDYIINTGSAGGFSEKLNIKDIVISSEVIHCDADSRGFGYQYGQIPQMPHMYYPNKHLVEKAEEVAREIEGVNVYKGLIGSGDSFISNEQQITHLQTYLPGLLAAEMEGAAIAQTCYLLNKPFVIIRAISDIVVKDGNAITFDEFVVEAGKTSASLIQRLLEVL